MRPSIILARHGRSIVGKIVLALAFALVMVGVSIGPALSEDNERHDKQQGRDHRGHQPVHRVYQPYHRVYQPYGYYTPPPVVYAPPPVVYVPPPSPGISLFFGFPIQIH